MKMADLAEYLERFVVVSGAVLVPHRAERTRGQQDLLECQDAVVACRSGGGKFIMGGRGWGDNN